MTSSNLVAMPQTAVSSTSGVEVNLENDPRIGFEFEDEMVLRSMLTLKQHQALAREVKFADKFDDIVLINNFDSGQPQEFFLYQLKHKKNSTRNIAWDDLYTKDNPFSLQKYFDSFIKIMNQSNGKQIKALVIMTNVAIGPSIFQHQPNGAPATYTNLNLVPNRRRGMTSYPITQDDLDYYFDDEVKCNGTANNQFIKIDKSGKRYKFSAKGVQDVKASFLSAGIVTQQHSSQFQEFLELLMFDVEQPSVDEAKAINQSILKVFFPFHWDSASKESCCNRIKGKVLSLFKPGQGNMADWATVSGRDSAFKILAASLKENLTLGSTRSYEVKALTDSFNELDFEHLRISDVNKISPVALAIQNFLIPKPGNTSLNDTCRIINVFNNESNATVITLKIFKAIKMLSLQHMAVMVQVNEEEGIRRLIDYFTELNKDVVSYKDLVTGRFSVVIEVLPFCKPFEETAKSVNELCKSLAPLTDLRMWIQFVIATQQPIENPNANEDLESFQDTPLECDNLPESTIKYLVQKTLHLENDKKTTLEELGVNGDFLVDPASLAELMVHYEKRPLYFGLPKCDKNLELVYIPRQLKLPYLVTDNMSQELKNQLMLDYQHFKKSIHNDHLPFDSEQGLFSYLWTKSNKNMFSAVKHHIVRSKDSLYQFGESLLLEETIFLGTGSKEEKLLIVVDQPGKGKSSLLSWLTNKFLEKPALTRKMDLLYRVNLHEIKRSIWKEDKAITETHAAVNFLVDNLLTVENNKAQNYSITSRVLAQEVIKQVCLNGQFPSVVLLFDGLDEISEEQRSKTLNVIRYLQDAKGIKQIILTSRPDNGLENKLEDYFMQFPLYLENFNEQDRVDFLMKHWNTKLRKENVQFQDAAEAVKVFAKALVKYAQHAFTHESESLLDVPLQCMIVSECFFEDLKNFMEEREVDNSKSVDSRVLCDENFELIRLYDRFYETKIDVFFQNKAILQDENAASSIAKKELKLSFMVRLKRLAVFYLMNDIDDAELLTRIKWHDYRNTGYSNDSKRALKLGLLQGVGDSPSDDSPNVKFIHRTFGEYFFASFLLGHFTQTKSDLLDSEFASQQVLERTFDVIIHKILVETQYAGAMRFFDRMLAKHLPAPDKPCPFASKDRASVIQEWSVIGQEKFNRHVAEFVVSQKKFLFQKWHATDIKKVRSDQLLRRDLIALEGMKIHPEKGIDGMVTPKNTNALLCCVSQLLLLCAKEYAIRSMSGDSIIIGEPLAHSMAMAFLTCSKTAKTYEFSARKQMCILLLHWFDRAKELSDEANKTFTKWFYKMFSRLIDHLTANEISDVGMLELEAFALACSAMKRHRDSPLFDELVRTKIFYNPTNRVKRNYWKLGLLFHDSYVPNFINKNLTTASPGSIHGDARVPREKGILLRSILSLSTSLFLRDISPFEQKVDWFIKQLDKSLAKMRNNLGIRDNETPPTYDPIVDELIGSTKDAVPVNITVINPFAFVDATSWLLDNLDRLEMRELFDSVLDTSLRYVDEALPLLIEISLHITSSLPADSIDMRAQNTEDYLVAKQGILCVLFWHLVLSDEIITYLSEDQMKTRTLEIFRSSIARKALIAFANADCCRSRVHSAPGLVLYFPLSMHGSESTRKTLERWFDNKVRLIWDQGEVQLVDYLFKDQTKWPVESTKQDEYDFNALPCLLFSDLVCSYIPGKLSPKGMEHFVETIRNVSASPGDENTLWNVIMQDDVFAAGSHSNCKNIGEKVKSLRDALQHF